MTDLQAKELTRQCWKRQREAQIKKGQEIIEAIRAAADMVFHHTTASVSPDLVFPLDFKTLLR